MMPPNSLLIVVFLAGSALVAGYNAVPTFPRFLDAENPAYSRVHITSERAQPTGEFTLAEEFIDLELGRAAYVETTNNVRTTWLVDIEAGFIWKYWPYQCERYCHTEEVVDGRRNLFPNVILFARHPQTELGKGRQKMFLFGISVLMNWFESPRLKKRYSKITDLSHVISNDLDHRPENHTGHRWTETNQGYSSLTFTEISAGLLQLNSFEYKERENEKPIRVNILSVERDIPSHVYHNELQLPLIYGCERERLVNAEMQRKFELLSFNADTSYHLKMEARAINFTGRKQISSELSTVEFAMSQSRDAGFAMSPVRAHMTNLQTGGKFSSVKTVVDRYYNIMYKVTADGTCTITNIGPMAPQQDKAGRLVFEFSNGLKLELSTQEISSVLSDLKVENFMKLETKDDIEFAYFSDSNPDLFRPKMTRIVRRFAFHKNGRVHLDSLAFWIFEAPPNESKIVEVYDFKITESRPMTKDTNSAHAFDVSRECFVNNQNMHYGRDYVWLELEYSHLSTEQIELLADKVAELKDAIYRSIRAHLNINYMRLPKMELLFGETGGFIVRMLVLDSPPLHLIYEEFKGHALNPCLFQKGEHASDLEECSELCRKESCFAMTFDVQNSNCSLATVAFTGNLMAREESKDTYIIDWQHQQFLPNDALRLERLVESFRAECHNASDILAFHEVHHQDATKCPNQLNNLRVALKLNGQMVDMVPTKVRVQTDEEDEQQSTELMSNLSTFDVISKQ